MTRLFLADAVVGNERTSGQYVPTRTSVALIGGATLLRNSLKHYLEGQELAISACMEGGLVTDADLTRILEEKSVVVLLLDCEPITSLRAIRLMLDRVGALPLVVVATEFSRGSVNAALRIGAKGLLCVDSEPSELLRAVHLAQEGKIHVDANVAGLLIREISGPRSACGQGTDHDLSHREVEIIQLLCDNLSAKEIARRLCLSVKTVENHKYHIYRKCGVDSILGLFRYAIHNSYVSI